MARMPIDTPQRKIGSRAVAIVHYIFDSDHWEFRQETGSDVGRDCTVELSENDRWLNHKIEGQIKGSKEIKPLKTSDEISFSMEIKTINYALGSPVPFVLFYVDVTSEVVYYLSIQDYFINHPDNFAKLEGDQEKLSLRIPICNVLNEKDGELALLAQHTYIDGPGRGLTKHK